MSSRRRARKLKTFAFAAIFLLAAGGAIWLIFLSDYFYLQEIVVAGTETVEAAAVEAIAEKQLAQKEWGIFPRSHLFFYRAAGITEALEAQFIRIAAVDLRSNIRERRLDLVIREHIPEGFWCAVENECAMLAGDGTILEPIERPTGIGALMIEDQSGMAFAAGTQPIAPQWLQFIRDFSEALAPEILIRKHIIQPESIRAQYIRSRTAAGWDILLKIAPGQGEENAIIVKTVLEEEIGANIGRLEYIDLRVPGRAYYKLR